LARLRRLAPYFLAGPISGPLLAGAVFNFKGGRPVLGTLYVVALVEFYIALTWITLAFGGNTRGI
jgi:hypothetical protein